LNALKWFGVHTKFHAHSPIMGTDTHTDMMSPHTHLFFKTKVHYLRQVIPTFTFANWTATIISTQPMHTVLVAVYQRATLLAFANFAACFVESEAMRAILMTVRECRTVS
jgi:hypothetical protein